MVSIRHFWFELGFVNIGQRKRSQLLSGTAHGSVHFASIFSNGLIAASNLKAFIISADLLCGHFSINHNLCNKGCTGAARVSDSECEISEPSLISKCVRYINFRTITLEKRLGFSNENRIQVVIAYSNMLTKYFYFDIKHICVDIPLKRYNQAAKVINLEILSLRWTHYHLNTEIFLLKCKLLASE